MADRFNCAELAASVTEYVDGAFDKARRRAFERHLARCVDCDMYLRQMRQTIELTGRLGAADVEEIPSEVREQLLEAFRAAAGGHPPG